MSVDLWLTFALASAALIVIPGPTVMLVLSYALGQGRKVAMSCALGVGLGDLVAMTASLLGLGAIVMASAMAFTLLKWGGAIYLAYLGISMLRSAAKAQSDGLIRPEPASGRKVFGHAFAVTALNPKSIGFFIAFAPHFIDTTAPLTPQFIILITTFATLGTLNALTYALLTGAMREKIGKPRVLRNMTRVGGLTLIGMGALTATLRRG